MNVPEESLSPKFSLWWPYFKRFYDLGGFDKIYAYLKDRASKGHKITPESSLTYRCFLETPPEKLKVLILGLCPYHSKVKGTLIADGLAMSCSKLGIVQPSLEQYYRAVEKELYSGLCLKCDMNPDLQFLADQGVMLCNAALTTEVGIAGKHQKIWAPFTAYFLDEVISTMSNVSVIFLGKEAAQFEKYLAPFQWSFCISHPASASYSGEQWDSEGVFKKVNQILKDQKKEEITWMQTS